MSYRCPKCQSTKIMPIASATGPRPQVPKSLITLIPCVLLLVLVGVICLAITVTGGHIALGLQVAAGVLTLVCIISALLFWRQLPNFKITMQNFMQQQKHWKCRECHTDWHN